jgi:hypothetical protein
VNFNHSVGIWHKDREKKQIFRKTAVIFFKNCRALQKLPIFALLKLVKRITSIIKKERKGKSPWQKA